MPPSPHVWLNGELRPLEQTRISPMDPGFLLGDGVYETMVARGGRPVAAREHWERLARSCEVLGLPVLPEAAFVNALEAVITANALPDARLRVTVSRGTGTWGEASPALASATISVTATPLKTWPPTEKVCIAPWVRNERGALAGIKSLAYAENLRCMAYAKERGCGEALLANTRGDLCEGTASNVFVVVKGLLMTPPLSSGCLPGVTRGLVIKACEWAGIECVEKDLPMSVLGECEEAFLTSATRDVHPIEEVEGRGLEVLGAITRKVSEAFRML